MKFAQKTDSGVSPVIGVILMVAITVILSAVIASFVLGLGSSVQQNPQAGVTFDQNSGPEVTVQLVSIDNADQVQVLTNDGTQVGTLSSPGGTVNVTTSDGTNALSAGDTITVTATLEGKTSVIQTYTVR